MEPTVDDLDVDHESRHGDGDDDGAFRDACEDDDAKQRISEDWKGEGEG